MCVSVCVGHGKNAKHVLWGWRGKSNVAVETEQTLVNTYSFIISVIRTTMPAWWHNGTHLAHKHTHTHNYIHLWEYLMLAHVESCGETATYTIKCV